MDNVSIKLDSRVSKQLNKLLKEFNYSTKTDFIREAIREKLNKLIDEREKRKAWNALFSAKGSLKGKGKFNSNEEFFEWRENEGSKELTDYLENKFSQK